MKVMIMHSCGHEEEHNISGQIKGREYRIAKLEERKCYDCWCKAEAEKVFGKVEIIKMHYGKYKHSRYKAVPNSYDARDKSIDVYVPIRIDNIDED